MDGTLWHRRLDNGNDEFLIVDDVERSPLGTTRTAVGTKITPGGEVVARRFSLALKLLVRDYQLVDVV